MCGRYGYSVEDAKEVYSRFQLANTLAHLSSHFNVAPASMNPVVTSHSPNTLSVMFWGLIPSPSQGTKRSTTRLTPAPKTRCTSPHSASRSSSSAAWCRRPSSTSGTSPPDPVRRTCFISGTNRVCLRGSV
jgi:hypothetical protein